MGISDSDTLKNSQWKFFKQKVRRRQARSGQRRNFPKKSEYFAHAKPRGGIIKGPNDSNNSSKQAQKSVTIDKTKPTGNERQTSTPSPRKVVSPRKEKLPVKQVTPKKADAIFVSPPRTQKDLAADVIRADCMVHGYKVGKTIGEGAYAKVKLAEVLPSKLARHEQLADLAVATDESVLVAIKVIDSKNVPKEFLRKFLPRELNNHCPLPHHENVVRVFEQFRTSDRYYVVMEYCSKGDLLDLINRRISESYKGVGEELARKLFKMMAEGVHHIHLNGIVHRDLKCENILVDQFDTIKITDFGFSTQYTPNKTSLLKTSCGSYAYTAPEVIKMKPYDGTKSDAWSLGVILFAMLNGRLPFNDAQLSDLEEDMKMQRLRFERNVSFESMVLVRRILQYNPSSRPTLADVLTDPWLTGKRPIPRQTNKPKWINPYSPRRDDGIPPEPAESSAPPCYYKGTVPERGTEATVTVNHDKCETVVLKSRTGKKKNIWTCGPPMSQRPNTWPRANNDNGRQKQSQEVRTRGSSANERKNTNTTVIVRQPDRRGKTARSDPQRDDADKNIKFSKWFMDKYMAGLEQFDTTHPDDNCKCCKAEACIKKAVSQNKHDGCEPDDTSCFLDDLDTGSDDEDPDAFRFPSPVRNKGDVIKICLEPSVEKIASAKNDNKKELLKKELQTGFKSTTVSARKSAPPIRTTRAHNAPLARSVIEKKIHQVAVKDVASTCRPNVSKTTESPRPNMNSYIISKSTTPAERVKYFRDRLMKLYGNDKVEHDVSELPPLMVQSLKPSTGSQKSAEDHNQTPAVKTGKVATIARKSASNQPNNFLRNRCATSGPKSRPVQRVVVHSSLL